MNSKGDILKACLGLLEEGDAATITLEAAARASGLSKPGLMYHFRTKEALMLGVIDYITERWEQALLETLGSSFESSSPQDRIRAYVTTTFTGKPGKAEFAIFASAVFRPALNAAWVARMEKWIEYPDDILDKDRGCLTLARLAADGLWLSQATGVFEISETERKDTLGLILDLLSTVR